MSNAPLSRVVADEADRIHDEIKALQADLQGHFQGFREAHGKAAAKALKAAITIRRKRREDAAALDEHEAAVAAMLEEIGG